MNLRDVKYFVALADTRHFGKAAERSFVRQPTLSAQIKKLEQYLGVQLIERQPRKVTLTETGARILPLARRILQETELIVSLPRSEHEQLAVSIIMEANRLLEANEVPLATSLYEEFIARQPSSPAIKQARTKLGWCYYLNEKLDDAEKEWQTVIRQGPADDPWVGESQWNMIRLLSGPKNQWEQAVSLCETVARNFPKQFRGQQALFTRAWLYWAHKRFDQARTAFDDLTTAFPDTAHHPPIRT